MPDQLKVGASQSELTATPIRQLSEGVPQFSANLQVDASGNGIVSGSGDRAAANAFSDMASYSKSISELATNTYQTQLENKAKMGGYTEADLPDPNTTVGENVRKAFVESQAIQTNLDIKDNIDSITTNPNLSEAGMGAALMNSANSMIQNHIPEMATTIRQQYAGQGVAAIYNTSKQRLADQRELQAASLVDQQNNTAKNYSQAYSAVQRNQQIVQDLHDKMAQGPVTQDDYTQAMAGYDSTADKTLADSQALFSKTLSSRVALGKMTPEQADITTTNLATAARNEFLSNQVVDKGLGVLDNVQGLDFSDKLAIAEKASTYANLQNNEADRAEKQDFEAQQTRWNQNLQAAQDAAYKGDFNTARNITQQLQTENESVGDKGLMQQLEGVNKTIDTVAKAGGAPHPEIFNDYKRQIQLGNFKTMDDVMTNLGFSGHQLNPGELQDLNETLQKIPNTVLASPGFKAVQSLVKLRLPDDTDSASRLQQLINGTKKSELQLAIEASRSRINDGLISGALDGTLKTLPQQQDYITSQIKHERQIIYAPEITALKDHGLTTTSSPVEINARVNSYFPNPTDDVKRSTLYNTLIRAQQKARQAE